MANISGHLVTRVLVLPKKYSSVRRTVVLPFEVVLVDKQLSIE